MQGGMARVRERVGTRRAQSVQRIVAQSCGDEGEQGGSAPTTHHRAPDEQAIAPLPHGCVPPTSRAVRHAILKASFFPLLA